jgi:hypothetical protein
MRKMLRPQVKAKHFRQAVLEAAQSELFRRGRHTQIGPGTVVKNEVSCQPGKFVDDWSGLSNAE